VQAIITPQLNEQQSNRRMSDAPLSFLCGVQRDVGKIEYARHTASKIHDTPNSELR